MGWMVEEGIKLLIEMDGWSFYEDSRGRGQEYYIHHDACPKGIQFVVEHEKGECSVMHWTYHRCQRCHGFPPDDILAIYLMYQPTPMTRDMHEWEAEVNGHHADV